MTFRTDQNRSEEDKSVASVDAWNKRLISVITDCEDDVRRYRNIIESIKGIRECNASLLASCMNDKRAHQHLILFTTLHIVEVRFQKACSAVGIASAGLLNAASRLHRHIDLIAAMMQAMFSQLEQETLPSQVAWDYGGSVLARLLDHRLRIAIDDVLVSLQTQFSCTLITVLMAAIEPAMKSVQDRLSLRPELPLDMRAFAGARLAFKCINNHSAIMALDDLATDISQIFKIPRTICLSA